jgi:excisionase family DNA binding protein
MAIRNQTRMQRAYYANPRGKPPGYLTIRQAMDVAQCSQPTIRRLIRKDRVRVVRWRYRILLNEADLKAWSRVRRYRLKRAVPAVSVPATAGTEAPQALTAEEKPSTCPFCGHTDLAPSPSGKHLVCLKCGRIVLQPKPAPAKEETPR